MRHDLYLKWYLYERNPNYVLQKIILSKLNLSLLFTYIDTYDVLGQF